MAWQADKCLLRVCLKQAKMSMVQLSEKTGISISQLSDYASDRRGMSLNNAKTLSKALECRIEDLYTWVEIRRGGRD